MTLRRLFEKLLIYPLDVQSFFDPATNVVADHQPSQLITVHQHDPFAKKLGGLFGRCRERRCCDEKTFRSLVPIQAAKEITDGPCSNATASRISLGLYIDTV